MTTQTTAKAALTTRLMEYGNLWLDLDIFATDSLDCDAKVTASSRWSGATKEVGTIRIPFELMLQLTTLEGMVAWENERHSESGEWLPKSWYDESCRRFDEVDKHFLELIRAIPEFDAAMASFARDVMIPERN